jgi:hypothetical protein
MPDLLHPERDICHACQVATCRACSGTGSAPSTCAQIRRSREWRPPPTRLRRSAKHRVVDRDVIVIEPDTSPQGALGRARCQLSGIRGRWARCGLAARLAAHNGAGIASTAYRRPSGRPRGQPATKCSRWAGRRGGRRPAAPHRARWCRRRCPSKGSRLSPARPGRSGM